MEEIPTESRVPKNPKGGPVQEKPKGKTQPPKDQEPANLKNSSSRLQPQTTEGRHGSQTVRQTEPSWNQEVGITYR